MKCRNLIVQIASLLDALMKCDDVQQAELLFNGCKVKDIQMYGAMMKGYIENDRPSEAINLFDEIEHQTDVTYVLFFNACAAIRTQEALNLVRKVSKSIPKVLLSNTILLTSLVDSLMKCGDVQQAEILFHESKVKVPQMYGAMMKGYLENNLPSKAIDLYNEIEHANDVNSMLLFSACAALSTQEALNLLKTVSKQVPASFFSNPRFLPSLVHTFLKYGEVEQAELYFNKSKVKDVQLYGAMMKAYLENNQPTKAINLFSEIEHPDDVVYIVLLNACAALRTEEASNLVKKISNKIPRNFFFKSNSVDFSYRRLNEMW